MRELSLREIQLAELEILTAFDKICRSNNLRYSLAGGTLLGAIRHKGFIPWDDDVDVCMPRPDYEKFIEIFGKSGFSTGLVLTSDRGGDAMYPFVKLLNPKIRVESAIYGVLKYLWIDIFPVDGLPGDEGKLEKIYKKSEFYRNVIGFSQLRSVDIYSGGYNRKLLSVFVKLYGGRRAIRNSEKLALRYDYDKCEYVGAVTWGCYGVGERMVKKDYERLVDVGFEGRKFLSMSCWDSYLKGIYGDYMQLPPEDKRGTHELTAYAEDDK